MGNETTVSNGNPNYMVYGGLKVDKNTIQSYHQDKHSNNYIIIFKNGQSISYPYQKDKNEAFIEFPEYKEGREDGSRIMNAYNLYNVTITGSTGGDFIVLKEGCNANRVVLDNDNEADWAAIEGGCLVIDKGNSNNTVVLGEADGMFYHNEKIVRLPGSYNEKKLDVEF